MTLGKNQKMKTLLRCLLLAVLSSAFVLADDKAASVVAQVSVRANGDLLVDGVKTDLRELHLLLAARRERPAEIWLYRAPSLAAHRVASEAVEIARSYALTVQPLRSDPQKILPANARSRTR